MVSSMAPSMPEHLSAVTRRTPARPHPLSQEKNSFQESADSE